jgi:hypothetical protein
MNKILIDEAVVGFDEWWHNEGSQAPKPTDDMYEHCKRMCEIAWANGAYKALEQPAQQKPAVAAYWAVVDWDGKHIQVDQDTMQLEVYETKHHAKANVNSRTKAMLVYISTTPPAPAQEPLSDERVSLIAHNIDDYDWNSLGFKESWHKGFVAGFRAAEDAHNIRMEK